VTVVERVVDRVLVSLWAFRAFWAGARIHQCRQGARGWEPCLW